MKTTTHRKRVPRALRSGLRNYWYPVIDSSQVGLERPVGVTRLGESLVVWRDGDGTAHVLVDRCAHRSARLSLGDVINGRLQCRYHGAQYDGSGQCRMVPIDVQEDGPIARRVRVGSYPTEERGGFIWAYLGDVEVFPPEPLSLEPEMEDPSYVWSIYESVWEANWLLVHDNTSDALHFPFLHGHFTAYRDGDTVQFGPAGAGNPAVTPENARETVLERFVPQRTEKGVFQAVKHRKKAADPRTVHELEFVLPCLVKVWVPFPDGGHPHRFLQYQYPIDENRTIVYAWFGKQADNEEERAVAEYAVKKFGASVAHQVFGEDSWICASQGDVDYAREHESLFPTDAGVAAVRQRILDAFEDQCRQSALETSDGDGDDMAAAAASQGGSA